MFWPFFFFWLLVVVVVIIPLLHRHVILYFVECILLTNNIDEKATAFAKIKSNNTGTVNY